jgi:hypothetical protein
MAFLSSIQRLSAGLAGLPFTLFAKISVSGMVKAVCMICRKECDVKQHDFGYYDLKQGGGNVGYICDRCSYSIQKEALSTSGINPDEVDPMDHFIRSGKTYK